MTDEEVFYPGTWTLVWCYFWELELFLLVTRFSCLIGSLTYLIVGSQIERLEEQRKQFALHIVEVQKNFRGNRARRHFRELKQGVEILQSCNAHLHLVVFIVSSWNFLYSFCFAPYIYKLNFLWVLSIEGVIFISFSMKQVLCWNNILLYLI